MRVHRSGAFWAYARASMSLAGYQTPLFYSEDGHLLLDGDYVNNMLADVMRLLGANYTFTITRQNAVISTVDKVSSRVGLQTTKESSQMCEYYRSDI
ncbi:PNPLA domain-containing protein [Aphelenchoides besseyi]|nr:PNPLA domain-containing protein [Aphelenchoides besseyi]